MRAVRSTRPYIWVANVMKKLVINQPRPGRSTVTMVTHVYDPETRRTRTVYLGSFGIGLDPDVLPTDGCIPPGGRCHGVSLSAAASTGFGPDDMAAIRDWLVAHGSHHRELAARRLWAQAEEDRRAREMESLRRQVEAELRPQVEREVRELMVQEQRASELEPLEAAMAALDTAAEYVVSLAARLRAGGHEVSNARRASLKAAPGGNPLDILQARANRVRLKGFARFETGCKDARLMARRPPKPLSA